MFKLNNKIEILVVEPNKEPYEKQIKNTTEEKKKIVGGLVQFVDIEENIDLVCNEEGKAKGLEINRIIPNDIICGTFFIVGQKGGDSISLTKEQIEKYKKYFNLEKQKEEIEQIKNMIRFKKSLKYMEE